MLMTTCLVLCLASSSSSFFWTADDVYLLGLSQRAVQSKVIIARSSSSSCFSALESQAIKDLESEDLVSTSR